MTGHFSGNRRYLYEFSDLFLVHCPRCDKRALVLPVSPAATEKNKQGIVPYAQTTCSPRAGLAANIAAMSKTGRARK